MNFTQEFLRHGEGSQSISKIALQYLKPTMKHYGDAFSEALNEVYFKNNKRFHLTNVIELNDFFIAAVFKYNKENERNVVFNKQDEALNLDELANFDLSKHLSAKRVIKLYPAKDVIIFIKPNQYRYWLASIGYRDADKCLVDLTKLGY